MGGSCQNCGPLWCISLVNFGLLNLFGAQQRAIILTIVHDGEHSFSSLVEPCFEQ